MRFIKNQKYNLIGIGLIILLFGISIYVRNENLKAPLSRNHEWITAHALTTAQIWDENGGPSAYNFNPVYSYKGEGNAYRRALGGIAADNGDVYYVSYPPFTYIYLYYTSQLFGGPSVFSVRFAALSLHFISALLLFFLLSETRAGKDKNKFNFAGIIAAGFYIFAQGNLWFHGNLFFADMMVQPFFIGGILLAIRYLKGNYKNEKTILILFFIVAFLGTYSEWLGLFSVAITGLFLLFYGIYKKQKKFLKPFLILACGSGLALGLTFYQYISIDGWEELKSTSERKYSERSGHEPVEGSNAAFSIQNSESFNLMKDMFNNRYESLENYIGYSFGIMLLLLIARKLKPFSKSKSTVAYKYGLIVIGLMIVPIILHYLLFFNFNSMHYFSGLKTATAVIFIAAFTVQISTTISISINNYFSWAVIAFFTFFFVFKAQKSTMRYLSDNSTERIDFDRLESAKKILEYATPQHAVFSNLRYSPEYCFYAHHNISPINDNDTIAISNLLELHRNTKGQYYHHEESLLKAMVNIELRDGKLVLLDTIVFN